MKIPEPEIAWRRNLSMFNVYVHVLFMRKKGSEKTQSIFIVYV